MLAILCIGNFLAGTPRSHYIFQETKLTQKTGDYNPILTTLLSRTFATESRLQKLLFTNRIVKFHK